MSGTLRLSIERASPVDRYIWRRYQDEQWRGFLWGAPGQAAGLTCMAWLVRDWPLPAWRWIAPLMVMAALWAGVALGARRFARVRAADPDGYPYRPWRWRLLAAAAVQSGVWGTLGFVLLPAAQDPWRATLVISLLAFAYTATLFSVHDFAMTLAGVVPCLGPLLLRMLLDARLNELYLVGVVLFSFLTCVAVARVIGGKLQEADRLRAEKIVLAEQLQAQIEQATQARERAEQADRQKGEFFAAASHDLRQPLHALMLLTSHLRHQLQDPQALDVVGRIGQAVGSLSRMFERMFDVARLDAGKIDNVPRPCAVPTLFATLDGEFGVLCSEKGLRWTVRAADAWAQIDPVLAERVLRNFLNNAVRYTERGGVLLRARVRGGQVVCQVWDSGCGIARAHRGRIFDDYFQGDRPGGHRGDGLGLGLGVVRRLATLAGWTVTVRSRPGRGSCFSVALPRTARPVAAPPSSAAAPMPAATPPLPTGTGTVAHPLPADAASVSASPVDDDIGLVALLDDEPQVLQATAAAMQGLGWRVCAATRLADLMAQLAAGGRLPDAAVSDFRLRPAPTGIRHDGVFDEAGGNGSDDERPPGPEGSGEVGDRNACPSADDPAEDPADEPADGLEALVRLRHEFGLDLPVLLLTADARADVRARARRAGIPLLGKPASAQAIHQALQSAASSPSVPRDAPVPG